MSDFLTRLAQRQLTAVPAVAPRVPPRFAPAGPVLPDIAPPASPRAPVVGDESSRATQRVILRVERDRPAEASMTPVAEPAGLVVTPLPVPHRPAPAEPIAPPPEIHHLVDGRGLPAERPAPESLVPAPLVAATPGRAALEAPDVPAVTPAEPPTTPAPHADPPVMAQSLVRRAHDAARPVQPPMPVPTLHSTAAPTPSPITVTIGRIEVRAVTPPPRRERTAVDRHTALSLKEYLDRRHGGGR